MSAYFPPPYDSNSSNPDMNDIYESIYDGFYSRTNLTSVPVQPGDQEITDYKTMIKRFNKFPLFLSSFYCLYLNNKTDVCISQCYKKCHAKSSATAVTVCQQSQ